MKLTPRERHILIRIERGEQPTAEDYGMAAETFAEVCLGMYEKKLIDGIYFTKSCEGLDCAIDPRTKITKVGMEYLKQYR